MKKLFGDLCISATAGLIFLFSIILTHTGVAQNKNNLSLGYELKTYSYSFFTNESYESELAPAYKGFLTLHYDSDLSRSFYYELSGDFLLPSTQTPTSSGPLSFNAANTGVLFGARLTNSLDLLAGVEGGLLWNMRVRAAPVSGSDASSWLRTTQPNTNFQGTLTAGLRYHLVDLLSITAYASRNYYQYSAINPRFSFDATPSFNEADLSSYSARLGVSLNIPWESSLHDDREPTYRRGAPIVEDRRFSLGYEMRNYTFSYFRNNNYTGDFSLMKKGFLRAQYKYYLTKQFFMETGGAYLIPNQEGSFSATGPINFKAANLDLLMGLRWGKFSLFTGFEGGLLWDMRIKHQQPDGEFMWDAPSNVRSSFTGSFKVGMEYHLYKYLSIKGKFFYNKFQNATLEPNLQTANAPAVNTAKMAPFSAGIGISVNIPWKSKYNRGAPPPRTRATSSPRPDGPTADHSDSDDSENGDDPVAKTEDEEMTKETPPEVTRPPESTPAQLTFTNPLPARDIMTSPFGDQREHDGLDINAEKGDDIVSVAQGEVIYSDWAGSYGKLVKVEHPAGFVSLYSHLSEILVEKGDQVEKGEVVGYAGNTGRSTGPHLHFELLRMDLPINPRRYIIHDWEDWNP